MLARPLCKRQLEHAYGRSEASHKIVFVCYIYNSLLQLIVLVLDLTRVLPSVSSKSGMPRSGRITVKSTPAKSLNWDFQTLDQFPADPQEQGPLIVCRSPGLPIRQSGHHGGRRWADRQQEQLLWCSDSGPGSSLSVRRCRARHPAIHLLNKEFSRRRWTRGSSPIRANLRRMVNLSAVIVRACGRSSNHGKSGFGTTVPQPAVRGLLDAPLEAGHDDPRDRRGRA
jgi:hypothetical protein